MIPVLPAGLLISNPLKLLGSSLKNDVMAIKPVFFNSNN